MTDPIRAYGWNAQPRNVETLLQSKAGTQSVQPILVSSIKLPDTDLVKIVYDYAKKELPFETFNHSMRVYYYGTDYYFQKCCPATNPTNCNLGIAIATHSFPTWLSPSFNETYFLTCLLHDIGTNDINIVATLMSFEFYGGMIALDLLKKEGAPTAQAESVAEAVMRHQDLGETGTLTTIGSLVQLATIFDNMGGHPELVHKATIEDVVKAFPRNKWSMCFAKTIRKENGLKPWAHTTHLGEEDFPNGVSRNKLMEPYE